MKNKLLFISIIACFINEAHTQSIKELNKLTFESKEYDLKKAFEYSNRAIDKINKSNKKKTILESDVLSIRGTLYQLKGNFKKAINLHFKALRIREIVKPIDLVKISNSKFNIANLYYITKSYSKSKQFHLESLVILKKSTSENTDYIKNYNSLGTLYLELKQLDSAYYYFNEGLHIIEKDELNKDPVSMDLYLNIGIYYEEISNLELAYFYLNKAIQLQLENNDLEGLYFSYHHIGIIHELKQNYSYAKAYYKKALNIAQKYDDLESLRDLSASLVTTYDKEGNSDSSAHYFQEFKKYSDLFHQAIQQKTILELDTKYKTKEKNIAIKNANERESLYKTGIIIASLTFLLILFFLIRNYRQKQRIALLQVDVKNNEINELLNQQEAASYEAMLEGQDQERLRIARELHDRLGSTLATIKLGLQNEEIPQAQQQVILVNTAISEVRTIAHDLSGGNIEQYGLAAALNELKNTLDRSGKITLNLFMETVNIQASLHVTIYRIVQELVSNTLKHAEATEITLQLSSVDEQLTLIYEDNGKGFDLTHYQPGMGITNIRHRIEKWNGSLEIDAQPNRGTIVI